MRHGEVVSKNRNRQECHSSRIRPGGINHPGPFRNKRPTEPQRKTSRFPAEIKTFQISGILTVIKKEEDEDYHLVIVDQSDEDLTMIVESPNPNCAAGSRFLSQITDVRRALDQKFGTFEREEPNVRVTVTGVAFFDRLHGQEGVASNGIELHPILAIEFH